MIEYLLWIECSILVIAPLHLQSKTIGEPSPSRELATILGNIVSYRVSLGCLSWFSFVFLISFWFYCWVQYFINLAFISSLWVQYFSFLFLKFMVLYTLFPSIISMHTRCIRGKSVYIPTLPWWHTHICPRKGFFFPFCLVTVLFMSLQVRMSYLGFRVRTFSLYLLKKKKICLFHAFMVLSLFLDFLFGLRSSLESFSFDIVFTVYYIIWNFWFDNCFFFMLCISIFKEKRKVAFLFSFFFYFICKKSNKKRFYF